MSSARQAGREAGGSGVARAADPADEALAVQRGASPRCGRNHHDRAGGAPDRGQRDAARQRRAARPLASRPQHDQGGVLLLRSHADALRRMAVLDAADRVARGDVLQRLRHQPLARLVEGSPDGGVADRRGVRQVGIADEALAATACTSVSRPFRRSARTAASRVAARASGDWSMPQTMSESWRVLSLDSSRTDPPTPAAPAPWGVPPIPSRHRVWRRACGAAHPHGKADGR